MKIADIEKTMKGLDCCIGHGKPAPRLGNEPRDCENCPYSRTNGINNTLCFRQLQRDALELLKAQEPHVMTITEAFDAEVAWIEMYSDPDDGVEPIIQPVIIRHYENGYWECLIEMDESPELTLFIDDFNSEFRFWTARPTDEQRKEVKWR